MGVGSRSGLGLGLGLGLGSGLAHHLRRVCAARIEQGQQVVESCDEGLGASLRGDGERDEHGPAAVGALRGAVQPDLGG